MYKHRGKAEYQPILNVAEDYRVEGLIVVGTHPKAKEYPFIHEALEKLRPGYVEEKIDNRFFRDIRSFKVDGKRFWFDVVYGAAYMSEVAHLASLLGSRANILLGTCGALRADLDAGDTVLPHASFGNESSTRMYQRDNQTFLYESDEDLTKAIQHRPRIDEGVLVTVQSMLAESAEDVAAWADLGCSAVDMESATLFALSNHFGVPAAALLLVADNLVRNELVGDVGYELLKSQRTAIRQENYEVALRVLLDF